MTSHDLPSGGGAYERLKDGTLKQVEAPTSPPDLGSEGSAEAVAAAETEPVQTPVKRPVKEA